MGNNYIKLYIILGSALTIVLVAVFMLAMPEKCTLAAILSPVFFTIVSLATLKIMTRSGSGALLKFSNALMLSNVVKMLASIAYLVVSVLLIDRQLRIPFVVVFLLMYVVFAVVDVSVQRSIFSNNDSNAKQQQ